jgi:hypothetical protein
VTFLGNDNDGSLYAIPGKTPALAYECMIV